MSEALPAASTVELVPKSKAEDRVSVASNWKLVWWRFRKNRLAVASALVLILFYLIVLVPDFFATQDPEATTAKLAFIPPQRPALLTNGRLALSVPSIVGARNKVTLRMEWVTHPEQRIPLALFTRGYKYKVLGLFETNLHLVGPADPSARRVCTCWARMAWAVTNGRA